MKRLDAVNTEERQYRVVLFYGYNSILENLFGYYYIPVNKDSSVTSQQRYHIHFQNRRTTITVDSIIAELLAVKLGTLPNHPEAHSLIREWFETTLRKNLGDQVPGGNRISQYARQYAVEVLANRQLMRKVSNWRLTQK